ncbi:hypothetical protein AAMO2058_000747700 [Amorphochlora amoebiformis]
MASSLRIRRLGFREYDKIRRCITTSIPPPSPLPRFLEAKEALRTAHHPLFTINEGTDRSIAIEFRRKVRKGNHTTQTSGEAPGFVQANFVALPQDMAYHFLLYCLKNPRPCPILAVVDSGSHSPGIIAPTGDVRTDIPKYNVYRHGELTETLSNIEHLWTEDMVGFLLGCSFSWEDHLKTQGLTPKNVRLGRNVSMYRTNIPTSESGPFKGNMVVSMRPYEAKDIKQVARTTQAYPGAHGGPIHWGQAEDLGIKNIDSPDFGDAVPIESKEIGIFWACGVTSQTAVQQAKLPLAISHAPGYMFVTDLKYEELDVNTYREP